MMSAATRTAERHGFDVARRKRQNTVGLPVASKVPTQICDLKV